MCPTHNTTINYSSNDDKFINATIYYTNELFHTTISNLPEVFDNKKSISSAIFKVELKNVSAQFIVVSYDYLVRVLKHFLENTNHLFACPEQQELGLVGFIQGGTFIWLDPELTANSYIIYSNEALFKFERDYSYFYARYKKIISDPSYIRSIFCNKDLDLDVLKQNKGILNLRETLTIC